MGIPKEAQYSPLDYNIPLPSWLFKVNDTNLQSEISKRRQSDEEEIMLRAKKAQNNALQQMQELGANSDISNPDDIVNQAASILLKTGQVDKALNLLENQDKKAKDDLATALTIGKIDSNAGKGFYERSRANEAYGPIDFGFLDEQIQRLSGGGLAKVNKKTGASTTLIEPKNKPKEYKPEKWLNKATGDIATISPNDEARMRQAIQMGYELYKPDPFGSFMGDGEEPSQIITIPLRRK